jgi:hypothetical protein
MSDQTGELSSAGHKLGQAIGDWFEEYFVLPLLSQTANELSLFTDNRFVKRTARNEIIQWEDDEGNTVDYDFVFELNGSKDKLGIPVAFIECFWRRGSRHSKDKARDDSGKLLPMRSTYPSARFLGIVAAGDFTEPARELIRSRDIDFFYVPKEKVVSSFKKQGLEIDYPDKLAESAKAKIAERFAADFSHEKGVAVASELIKSIGKASVSSYVDRVKARLSALPQEIRLILRQESSPIIFKTLVEVTDFLDKPKFSLNEPTESYIYQSTYSDGTEFERIVTSIADLRAIHSQIIELSEHMEKLSQ